MSHKELFRRVRYGMDESWVHDAFVRVRTYAKGSGRHEHQGVACHTARGLFMFTSNHVGHDQEAKTPDRDQNALEHHGHTKHRARQTETHQYLRPVVFGSHIYPTSKQADWDSPSAKEVGAKTK